MSDARPGRRFFGRRLALAFAVAVLSDGLSVLFAPAPPLQWSTDAVTALLLFTILGWQWILLPGLITEAIPGLALFPFWVLVVAVVARWGSVRRTRTPATDTADQRIDAARD